MKKLLIVVMILCMNMSGAYAGELQILTVEEPPGNFTDEHGEIAGLTLDFVREIQRRIGNTDKIRMMPGARLMAIVKKEPNVVAFSIARTPEREHLFHWIVLVMRKPWALYAKKDLGLHIKTLEDAKKVRAIGVTRGDIRADWLKQQGFTNLEPVVSHELNLRKLMIGRVPLIFYSPHGIAHFARKLNFDFHEIELVLAPHSSLSHIVMSKVTPEKTVQLWQKTAQQVKDDGTFEKLAEKWVRYSLEQNGIESEVKDGALNFWKE